MSRLGVILCGFITGSVMAVPGISGGSAAMVIGVYDDLLRAVSRCAAAPVRAGWDPRAVPDGRCDILAADHSGGGPGEVPVPRRGGRRNSGDIPESRRAQAECFRAGTDPFGGGSCWRRFRRDCSPRASADSPTWRCNSPAECSWLLRLCCRESARHTSSTCSEFTTP